MKYILPLVTFLLCLYSVSILQTKQPSPTVKKTEQNRPQEDFYDGVKGMKKAAKYLNRIRENQHTNNINHKDVLKAQQATRAASAAKETTDMEWEFLGPKNIGGRTRTLVIDKDNPDKLYTGGVGGGIFMSDDAGDNWYPYAGNADLPCQAIVSGCQDVNGHIYLGTGEGFFFFAGQGVAGILGEGIYKSTDDGTTFELLSATMPINTNNEAEAWAQVNVLAAHPTQSIIYAGIGTGFRISEDGGNTWSNPLPSSITDKCWDVAIATNGTVHVSIGNQYFKASDGLNFEEIANSISNSDGFPANNGRKCIAVAPSNPNYVYVVAVHPSSGCLAWVAQSTDEGTTWAIIGTYEDELFTPLSNGVHCQGSYDLALTVNPLDEEQVYLAGVSLWTWTAAEAWTQIDNLYDYPGNLYYLHADKHQLTFAPNNANTMYVLSDGGIFKSNNMQSNTPTFEPINKGLLEPNEFKASWLVLKIVNRLDKHVQEDLFIQ